MNELWRYYKMRKGKGPVRQCILVKCRSFLYKLLFVKRCLKWFYVLIVDEIVPYRCEGDRTFQQSDTFVFCLRYEEILLLGKNDVDCRWYSMRKIWSWDLLDLIKFCIKKPVVAFWTGIYGRNHIFVTSTGFWSAKIHNETSFRNIWFFERGSRNSRLNVLYFSWSTNEPSLISTCKSLSWWYELGRRTWKTTASKREFALCSYMYQEENYSFGCWWFAHKLFHCNDNNLNMYL